MSQPDISRMELPPWSAAMRDNIGVHRNEDGTDNPKIVEFFRYTQLGAQHESVAWCSAAMCWCAETSGYISPRSALARDWLHVGIPLNSPVDGCIVVLRRGDDPSEGHVTTYVGGAGDGVHFYGLGGNQHGAVNISLFRIDHILPDGFRWLKQHADGVAPAPHPDAGIKRPLVVARPAAPAPVAVQAPEPESPAIVQSDAPAPPTASPVAHGVDAETDQQTADRLGRNGSRTIAASRSLINRLLAMLGISAAPAAGQGLIGSATALGLVWDDMRPILDKASDAMTWAQAHAWPVLAALIAFGVYDVARIVEARVSDDKSGANISRRDPQ